MIFENKLTTGKYKIVYVVLIGLISALTAYFFFEPHSPNAEKIVLGIISLLVCAYIFLLILKPDFVYISDTDNKITIRYYSSHPFFRKYKAFEIPKRYVSKFLIKKSFMGIRKDLILTATGPKGIVTFPAVSITGLNKSEVKIVDKFLVKLENDLKMGI